MKVNVNDTARFSIADALSDRKGETHRISSVIDEWLDSRPAISRPPSPTGRQECRDTTRQRPQASVTRMTSGKDWWLQAVASGMQRQLCGPLWYEQEICILFADTNVGKSLLAVQIADMISRGAGCATTLPELLPQTPPQQVVYADFELSMTQFARRYSAAGPDGDEEAMTSRTYYAFSPMFHRVELFYDTDNTDPEEFARKEFADLILGDLERRLAETGAKVLIIDNITFMASGTETAADAMPLMKKLTSMKKRLGLSILLLAHTPKRSLSNPLTRNDLQGSKMLINFADSAFAIGSSSQGADYRYIKQIKQRNCEEVYGPDNVLLCLLGRTIPEFVGFASAGTGPETPHLAAEPAARKDRSRPDKRELATTLRAQGKTPSEIAAQTGIPLPTVYRWLQQTGANT